jgi:cytochrome c-type biogenesis protein CcsB
MDIIVLGLNHKTAPVHIRERVAFPEKSIHEPLRALHGVPGVRETMILSTCNRVEIAAVVESREQGAAAVRTFVARHHEVAEGELAPHLYLHAGAFYHRLPSLDLLDRVNYRSLTIGFPLLTLGIITGALWAENAWGSYWQWDPKETWSLITWFIYAALVHARLTVGWRGRKAAWLSIVGFLAVLFTFLGVNLLLGGLHSYN